MDNNNEMIRSFFKQINDLIDFKLNKLTKVSSAIIHSVNLDGTYNIIIPPSKLVYHNIQNQSVYQNLTVGDSVKILIENGDLSNMWILGTFGLNGSISGDEYDTINTSNTLDVNETIKNNIVDSIYPVGSIYISVNGVNPKELFGGTWRQIKDVFLLSCGDTFLNGETGGEINHELIEREIPMHSHSYNSFSFESNYADPNIEIINMTDGYGTYIYESQISTTTYGGVTEENSGSNSKYDEGQTVPHNNMPPYLAVYMWERIK